MRLYTIIAGFFALFHRLWTYVLAFVPKPDPVPFMARIKRSIDTWSASVNLRRIRKTQRHAARSRDRFAFA